MGIDIPCFPSSRYTRVADEEDGSIHKEDHNRWSLAYIGRFLLILLVTILAICGWIYWVSKARTCGKEAVRIEWRGLTTPQKHDYIAAVQCLKTRPSRIGMNHTLYDDFPFVHSHFGEYVHDAAPFLAWHRYFVHIYETALKNECGYAGNMPFWNWELDWQDVTKAPVWNDEHGFGTTGDAQQSKHAILKGYCLVDGPFKDFTIPYLDDKYYPHCLSRGFLVGEELRNQSKMLRPDMIEDLLSLHEYESFNLGLEHGPHLAIPHSIRGDFSLLTAPSDPVFFLHHAQLDRLWWRWQALHPENRLDYIGDASHRSKERASVDDLLLMGGLAPDIAVSQVLETHGNLLCYQY